LNFQWHLSFKSPRLLHLGPNFFQTTFIEGFFNNTMKSFRPCSFLLFGTCENLFLTFRNCDYMFIYSLWVIILSPCTIIGLIPLIIKIWLLSFNFTKLVVEVDIVFVNNSLWWFKCSIITRTSFHGNCFLKSCLHFV
jgi:hypothetical protein